VKSHENNVVWNLGHFQYVIAIFAFNCISRFRKPFWTNRIFTSYFIIISTLLLGFLLLVRNTSTATIPGEDAYDNFLSKWLTVPPKIPLSFRFFQLGEILLQFILCTGLEVFIEKSFIKKNMNNFKTNDEEENRFKEDKKSSR
jgi:hypothetical protein